MAKRKYKVPQPPRNVRVIELTAGELLTQLLALKAERPDFDELPVYTEVIDNASYVQNLGELLPGVEYYDQVEGDGVVYGLVVPQGFTWESGTMQSTGYYLLIQGAVDGDEDVPVWLLPDQLDVLTEDDVIPQWPKPPITTTASA